MCCLFPCGNAAPLTLLDGNAHLVPPSSGTDSHESRPGKGTHYLSPSATDIQ